MSGILKIVTVSKTTSKITIFTNILFFINQTFCLETPCNSKYCYLLDCHILSKIQGSTQIITTKSNTVYNSLITNSVCSHNKTTLSNILFHQNYHSKKNNVTLSHYYHNLVLGYPKCHKKQYCHKTPYNVPHKSCHQEQNR